MRIGSLDSKNGPFGASLSLLPKQPSAPPSANFTTVLIGANGTAKSLALRLITDACLNIDKYESAGRPVIATGITYREGRASKVLSVSGTPLDRFPRGGRPGPSGLTTIYDRKPYVYIGQKAVNGMAGVKQSERTLAYLFLKNLVHLPAAASEIGAVFNRFKLPNRVWLGFESWEPRMTPGKLTKILTDATHIRKQLQAQSQAQVELHEQNRVVEFGLRILNEPELHSYILGRLTQLRKSRWLSPFAVFRRVDMQEELEGLEDTSNQDTEQRESPDAVPTLRGEGGGRELNEELPPVNTSELELWYYLAMLRVIRFREIAFDKSLDDVSDSAPTNGAVYGEDLSSGQWHWITSMCGVALEAEDNCAVLVDEPENSLHPNWQRDFLPEMHKMLARRTGCHVVVATHSALVASSLPSKAGCVFALRRSVDDIRSYVESTQVEPTFGWNATDVLEELFSMPSTRAPAFSQIADEAIQLIADGKEKHVERLNALLGSIQRLMLELPAHDPMRRVFISVIAEISAPGVGEELQ